MLVILNRYTFTNAFVIDKTSISPQLAIVTVGMTGGANPFTLNNRAWSLILNLQDKMGAVGMDDKHFRSLTPTSHEEPVTLADVVRVAHYYGTSRGLAAHRLRNLRLLSDDRLERLEKIMRDETRARTHEALQLPEIPHEMDPLRSRLATLAADAFEHELIDKHKFDTFANLAGVRDADRAKLLVMTG